jgi:hypothetical protein
MCSKPALGETLKAFEAVGIDGRTGRHVLSYEREDRLGFEVWNYTHPNTTRPLASFFDSY